MNLKFNGVTFETHFINHLGRTVLDTSFKDMNTVITLMKEVITKDKAVVDIGANFGQFLLRANALGSRHIYGIELSPMVYGELDKLVKYNNVRNTTVINKAIWKSTGDFVGWRAYPGSFAVEEGCEEIETITMTDYLKTLPLEDVNLIKIDIEGAEQYNLKYFNYLAKQKGLWIHLELHTPYYSEEVMPVLLKKFKLFDCYLIKYGKLTPYANPNFYNNHIVLRTKQ